MINFSGNCQILSVRKNSIGSICTMAKRSGHGVGSGGKKVKVECSDVCEVGDISANTRAMIRGLVVSVSPIQRAGNFEAELSDGNVVVRVVGFEKQQREILHNHTGQVLVLRDCQVQLSMYSHQMEILLKSYTKIEETKVQIEVEDLRFFLHVTVLYITSY